MKIVIILIFTVLTYTAFSLEDINLIEKGWFVSNISARLVNKNILITWKNPRKDFNHYVTVYRSTEVINSIEMLRESERLGVMQNGEEEFLDSPGFGKYYYCVLLTDKEKSVNVDIFIPFRNYTLSYVELKKPGEFEIVSLSTDIKDSIILKWNYSSDSTEDKNVLVFRNTVKIDNQDILSQSLKIAKVDIKNRFYIDKSVANIHYYYALFVEGDKKRKFIDGVSFTSAPIMIRETSDFIDNFSHTVFTPLPLLTLSGSEILQTPLPESVDGDILKIVNSDFEKYPDIYRLTEAGLKLNTSLLPFKFLSDESYADYGDYKDEYSEIMMHINNVEYDKALLILEDLLTLSVSSEVLSRSAYYSGLLYYLNGNYYKSHNYFLISRDRFREEVIPFINSIYRNIYSSLDK